MVAENNGESMADSTSVPLLDEQMPVEIEETNEQKMGRAQTLFAEGKRALAAGNLATANEKLSETCTLYTQLYDPFAVECFEPHMLYGKALLELSRLEPGVFNNALEGVAEEEESMDSDTEEGETEKAVAEDSNKAEADQSDEQFGNADELTEDQREEIQEQVDEALAENAEALDKGEMPPEDPAQAVEDAKDTEEPSADDVPEVEDETKDDDAPEECVSAEEGAAGEEATAPETDAAEDTATNVQNLQLAWEVLDVARAVCDKQEKTDEWQQKKSEVLLLLGDVSIEDENYKQAIDDLAVCLDIQQKIFSPVDRRIAETLFQMARAFNLSFEFAKAADYYKKAFDVIKLRVDAHEAKMAAGVECPDEKASLEKEILDLKDLLPDIQLKIDDSLESAKNAELIKEQQGESSGAAFEDKETAASKPIAADISSLVRKPVKRSVEPEESDMSVKRCKGDEGDAEVTTTNGNGHTLETNGDNGHAATADA